MDVDEFTFARLFYSFLGWNRGGVGWFLVE